MADCYKMLNTTDPKANFMCGSRGIDADLGLDDNHFAPSKVEYIDLRNVDYMIDQDQNKDKDQNQDENEKKQKTLSYMSVNTIDEGIEWYRNNYPKIPEDLYPIMARWNWGDIGDMTKKELKNDLKRVNKGKKPKQMIIEQTKPNFVIDFGKN